MSCCQEISIPLVSEIRFDEGEDFAHTLFAVGDRGILCGNKVIFYVLHRLDEKVWKFTEQFEQTGALTILYVVTDGNKVYDTFDGRQWEQKSQGISGERYMDTAETLAAVRRYDRKYQADYLVNRDIKIRYKHFRTRFLFAPLKMRRPGAGGKELLFQEDEGSLYFDRKEGYGTEYELSFFQLNTG